jgi:hypothetical protein
MVIAPLIHIGFHKTGTSWLQDRLFESAAVGFMACGSENDVKRELVRAHDLEFDPDRAREFFRPRFERAVAEGLVPVLSAERLCGDMLFGAYDSARIAGRLASVFPTGRVLIVIREQRRMLFSSYHQYVKMGGLLRLKRYLRKPKHAHPWPCDLRHFAYDRLITHYHGLFGAENVLVLPYELFQRHPVSFLSRIAEFAGATPQPGSVEGLQFESIRNKSWPAQAIAAKRHANRVIRGRLNPWAPIKAHDDLGRTLTSLLVAGARKLPAKGETRTRSLMIATIESAVGTRYRESNARTSALIGVDLAQYGYDLPEGAEAERLPDRTASPVG